MNNENNPYASNSRYAANMQLNAAPTASPQQPRDLIKDTSTAAFSADVIQESRRQPVLVDFWAPWCGPCKQLTPILEKAVLAAGGRVKLVKMNIDEHPSVAGQLGIQSIPAVLAFRNGQPVDGFMGAIPESQIREFIQRIGGGDNEKEDIAEALATAADARAAGDATTAAEIYSALMEQAPETLEAIAGLAELMFETGNAQGAIAVLDSAPAEKKDAPVLAAVRARISLAEQAESLGEAAEFECRLAADPNDHQARFDLAMILNAQDKRMEAADNLLAIIRTDRSWNEDAARTQLLKLFEAWGAADQATLAARRKLSSVLFS